MNTKVLKTLEFNKIIDMLVSEADSEPGKRLCGELLPVSDIALIREYQRETAEAVSMILKKGSTSFGGNRDLKYAVKSLEKGASLSAGELLHIAAFLNNVNRVKAYGKSEETDDEESIFPLDGYFEILIPLTQTAAEIERCILSEEELADDASPALRDIRRKKNSISDRIHTQLNSMINGSYRTYLQDAVITMRGDRYCIPVKSEYKGSVPGIVHDQSQTGSTFFIEPAAIVNLNNEVRELEIEENKEIEKILSVLSASVGEHAAELLSDMEAMTKLDFIFAKGKLAVRQNAMEPQFNRKHIINIRKGRHPLLDAKRVVPIDVRLGQDFDLLVITGPNTGGKTVTLKTVGLLSLMGQAGLHIPAGDRSELTVFNDIFADIGDEQSIEQNLSTFSSHMVGIVDILKNADEHSLCLFDELGAGTDPVEGAALAIAILDTLHSKHIRTVATTHYSELKIYALESEGVENAGCEFDVETLRPTYRLLIGIPGKSNAFAISSKLGLPEAIIDKARTQISTENESFEDVISGLEASRLKLEQEKSEIAGYKERIKTLEEQLKKKNERIDDAKERIIQRANEEARAILQEAKDVADETIRDVNRLGKAADVKELEKRRHNINSKIKDKNSKLSIDTDKAKPKKELDAKLLKKGENVRIVSLGLTGSIAALPDDRGNLYVQCGIMRMKTNVRDLEYAPKEAERSEISSGKAGGSSVKMSKALSVSPEINLLGNTVDEALARLDKYLDDAYLAHLSNVRVVHGKGTGALRSAIHKYLKTLSYVTDFRLGEYGEGDAGVTIVTFK
ncbi:MAG: endonuclease MutS2 [Lachnospiraceae bacterium]|nr:endonuclease MutS2 [Lachnospiraceae bacterium]